MKLTRGWALTAATSASLTLSWIVVTPATAQQRPITWTLTTDATGLQQGKSFAVKLAGTIPFGWHLYSTTQPPGGPIPTVIVVGGDSAMALSGSIRSRDPELAPDNNFNIVTETYVDSVTFVLPVVSRAAGTHTLRVKFHYQTCTDRYCLPPIDELRDLQLQFAPGVNPLPKATEQKLPPTATTVHARGADPALMPHPITWSLTSRVATPQQGKQFLVAMHAEIPGGWHLYSPSQASGGPIATTFSIPADARFVMTGAPLFQPPSATFDSNFNMVTETFSDSVTIALPAMPRASGSQKLHVDVRYQACTDRTCKPPQVDALELALVVAPGDSSGVAPSFMPRIAGAVGPGSGGGTTTQSLPAFLLLAMVMGALSLLTPCVFPMIPITVSYFTRTNETARRSPARNALVYAAGIIATFTVLGMAIAVLVGAGGINRFAANPWINLLVAGIFIAFALNLFGVYEIGLPASLLTRLDGATRRGTGSETLSIVLMGLTFTLTSFTCTTPFVGTLLVMAAQGSWIWPLSGLLVFSGVFALPFFLLALMPSAVAKLPRSGSWLRQVKVVMGFVELATAMKFLSNADLVLRWGVFTRTVVLGVWIAIALLTVLYVLGIVGRADGEQTPRRGPIRLTVSAAVLAIAVYLGVGLSGRRVGELESFLPPPEGGIAGGETSVRGELPWMVNSYDAGLARARAEHKQVLVDFTGYTCTNCRWMEANMFPKAEVVSQLEKFVRVRLYTDGQGELYRKQQQMEQDKLGTVALPFYAIVDSLGDVKAQFLGMTRNTGEFVQFLALGRSVTNP